MPNHVCWTELILSDMNLDTHRPSHFLNTHKLPFLLKPQYLKLRNNCKERNSMLPPGSFLAVCWNPACFFKAQHSFLWKTSLIIATNTLTGSVLHALQPGLFKHSCASKPPGNPVISQIWIQLGWDEGWDSTFLTSQWCNSCPWTTVSLAKLHISPLVVRVGDSLAHLARLWVPGGQQLLICLPAFHNTLT